MLHDGVKGVDGPRSEDGRHETEAERIDRNLLELLQELRVAGIGVQVLFGFLLAIPFTNQFAKLDHAQQVLYTVDLVLAALAIALLSAPVAHHRVLFRQHEKKSILRIANVGGDRGARRGRVDDLGCGAARRQLRLGRCRGVARVGSDRAGDLRALVRPGAAPRRARQLLIELRLSYPRHVRTQCDVA